MKRAWIVALALLFAAAGFAEPSPAPLSEAALAVILAPPAPSAAGGADGAGAACAPRLAGAEPAAARPTAIKSACNATAQCYSGTVSCSGNSNCSAVDRNCAVPTAGYAICDGVYHGCPVACTYCDQCAATSDCITCCQCDGYSYIFCARNC